MPRRVNLRRRRARKQSANRPNRRAFMPAARREAPVRAGRPGPLHVSFAVEIGPTNGAAR
ncbi:hypothetical protein C6T66_04360 [Burkholderia multivorans]|uniref:Uncharacterized protein n=1 Tax=Burkholderia multivorans TaxID=87883 RepID=A0A8E2RZM9_9BURK|nr:hypothetical protein C6P76_00355 [Burkholderia multivorans]PRE23211.1 hypothetical protein C6P79_22105 [Burkholderia multivorans]PRF27922.1 hypothetical protein C6P98_02875 [Burkholderia multivorans]PRG92517.1 hypothetical protein C6T66_04360 [Burkholderia multivorans]PRH00859.1 hypothetical protein C6T60_23780 [Burkholderia multivorans]